MHCWSIWSEKMISSERMLHTLTTKQHNIVVTIPLLSIYKYCTTIQKSHIFKKKKTKLRETIIKQKWPAEEYIPMKDLPILKTDSTLAASESFKPWWGIPSFGFNRPSKNLKIEDSYWSIQVIKRDRAIRRLVEVVGPSTVSPVKVHHGHQICNPSKNKTYHLARPLRFSF